MTYLILISYLIGSIPFGLILTKLFGYGDIRTIGSGNIGATNVLRTGNKTLTAISFICDIAKGFFPVLIAAQYFDDIPNALYIAGFFAMIGHIFSIWLKFKGGKGVSTSLGIVLAFSPVLAGLTFTSWIIIAILSRMSSLSALIVSLHIPLYALAAGHPDLAPFLCVLIALLWFTHRGNIKRLLDGTEPKIGDKK